MIPVLTKVQIKQADAFTIDNEPISSLNLMERAVHALWSKMKKYLSKSSDKIVIVCGTGNNGGDGLVLARILHKKNYDLSVDLLNFSEKQSEEFKTNLDILEKLHGINIRKHKSPESYEISGQCTHIIDAVFGVGFEGASNKNYLEVFQKINQSATFKMSIDMPSGLPSDGIAGSNEFIQADKVFTFQCPKLSLLLPSHQTDFELVDIGLDKNHIQSLKTEAYIIEASDVKLPDRPKHAYKNLFGHTLICAGSTGMYGAAILCSKAAFASGSGLVTNCIPKDGVQIIHIAVPESMVLSCGTTALTEKISDLNKYNVLAIGPGIGMHSDTALWLKELLQERKQPAVMDADALNIIAENKYIDCIKKGDVLTPHEGELKRLIGNWANDLEKIDKLKSFAKEKEIVVVLKGAYTCIAVPDGTLYFNTTGHPAMATAGSGDVLCGIIAGLMASGLSAEQASKTGVYYHGKAGQKAAEKRRFIKASNIIENLFT